MRTLPLLLLAVAVGAQTPPVRRAAPAKPAAAPSSYRDLKFPPAPAISLPKTEDFTLANGMKVVLIEDHELPSVDGVALVRTGNLFDPPDKIGLATITGMVLRGGGTVSRPLDVLNEELDNLSASVESEIGESSGSVRFSALKATTDAVLEIFKDVLTAPAFRQDKVDQARTQLHDVVAHRNDTATGIASRELISAVYGKENSYGWLMEHSPIDRVRRADLLAFYRRYFFPANVILGISGDFDSAAMKASLEKLFASWTVQQQPVPGFPKMGASADGVLLVAEKPEVTPPVLMIGERSAESRDKDNAALAVMVRILGAGSGNHIMQRLQPKVGTLFAVSATWTTAWDHPGLFTISGAVKPLTLADTLKTIREEVERIRTTEVGDAELKAAKDAIMNAALFSLDTRAKVLQSVLITQYFGYPKDFIQQYQNALAAVSRADVMRAAKEHLDPAKLMTVVVGNPLDFGLGMEPLGKRVPISLEIPPSDGTPSATDAAGLQLGKQILARAQQAMGGADKLAAVKDFTQIDLRPLENGSPGKETLRWLAPVSIREDLDTGGRKIALYSDGKTGWISSSAAFMGLTPAHLKQIQGDIFRVSFTLLLSDRVPDRTVYGLDENTIEISDKSGNTAQVVLDPQTSLPTKVLYRMVDANSGASMYAEDDLSDFRDVSGIKLPYHITEIRNGQKTSDVAVTEIKLNSGLKLQDLNKRP
jgi:zinc protease